ncbi:MAG: polysaccharide pyruvyl transferase family protein [Clostridium sp.]|nr:polysaccharide pyruvyl transferase family protein [Clostridium sp.]
MKFGRLIYQYTGTLFSNSDAMYNIGDNIQTYAIDNIYKRMGIPPEDIIDINFTEMAYYSGDYVIVPIVNGGTHYKRFHELPTSDRIIPLLISFSMLEEDCDELIPYFRKYMPIGCRDEATLNMFRRKGVEAYLSGCLTLTLPKRKEKPDKEKVFLVDIPTALEKYMPEAIKENCEYVTHEGKIGVVPMSEATCYEVDALAKTIYTKYEKEATLVITSRLHAAVPCIAMGIPVILAIDNIDERFGWLDKLIPIYDAEHFGEIDWNPHTVDVEELKESIIKVVSKRLKYLKESREDIYELSDFWEKRNKVQYNYKLYVRLQYMRERFSQEQNFGYIIWGAGVHGKQAYKMIREYFPNAELMAVVDNYMEGTIFGLDIIKPKEISLKKFDYALITTHPGRFEAVELLTAMGKKQGLDWCYFMSKDVPEEHNNLME